MDLELVNYINLDLKWNMVKKGPRSTTRRPRKPGAVGSKLDVELGNKIQGLAAFGTNKSGIDVIGRQFAEKVVDAPLKKRRLSRQSPSPPPRSPCLNGERALSPESHILHPHHEDSSTWCRSNSAYKNQETKSKTGLSSSNILKLTEKDVPGLDDFSGIELLAAAACGCFIHDSADNVEEFSLSKEHQKPGVQSCTVDTKETMVSTQSDGSSVQDCVIPDVQNLHDNGKKGGEKSAAPSKGVRLHWDLNTMMDEWEEPCYDSLVESHSHENCLQDVYNDGLESVKLNSEGNGSRYSEGVGAEERSVQHGECTNQLSGKHGSPITVEDLTCSREVMATKTIVSKTSDGESSPSKSDVVDSLIHPAKCEGFSASTTSALREQTIVKGESDTIDDSPIYFEPKDTMSKSDRKPISEEVMQGGCQSPKLCKSYSHSKVTLEDPLSDCCGSNLTQDEQGHMAEGDALDKVQAGYDSPFEDGELREAIEWEEDEVEERDCVYYESDNIYEDDFGTDEHPLSEKSVVRREHAQTVVGPSSLLVKQVEEKFQMAGTRRLEGEPNNDIKQDAKADAFKRPHCLLGSKAFGCQLNVDESYCGSGKDFSERKNGQDESRTVGGNLLHIDGSSFDVCSYGDYGRRSRGGRDLDPERFMGREKVSFQGRDRSDMSGPWTDSSSGMWDLKSSHEYHRLKNVNEDSAARFGGSRNIDSNQSRNYNPRGTYRTFYRRPSPSERNDAYGIHRGPPVRSLSRDKHGGGSGFHPQGLRRAPEEEYHDAEPCYLERKVRCSSPNFNRPGRRSQSRSRSGSPIAWRFQKRRKSDPKRQSPDHEARFQAERYPFQKPNFSGQGEAGFVSLTRGRVSPVRTSRCFDDWKFMDGQFRDKRPLPVAMIRRNQRLEPSGYPERLKSDDHLRFGRRPERFSRMTGPGRDHKYNTDDIRKHDDKHEKVKRVGRCEDAGGVSRFKYAVDSFPRDGRNEDSRPTGTVVHESTGEEKGRSSVPSRFPHT